MVQLRTQRTALILYGVLLVLPTLVLGGLQWRQLQRDQEAEREAIPHNAEDAANRFRALVRDGLQRLIDAEEERPFFVYGSQMIASDASLAEATAVSTPLVSERRPEPILAWFAFDLRSPRIDLWGGAGADRAELAARYEPPVREMLRRFLERRSLPDMLARWDAPRIVDVSMLSVVFTRLHERDLDCMQYHQVELARRQVTLDVTPFHLQFFVDQGGTGRLIATRRVIAGQMIDLEGGGECFDALSQGMSLVQGFLIDTDWFFRELPTQLARSVLDTSQRFVPWGGPPCCGDDREYHAEIRLIANLAIETNTPEEQQYAPLRIAVDNQAIEATQRKVRLSFLGLAAMLAVSLGTGMWLLLRSVRHDLDQASRTENFVAAVTHELRTPLTSIKMYGEMLLDGESTAPEQQREYYKRIVRASERLNTLVERVLEKARLTSGAPRSEEIGDLNAVVAGLERQLSQYGPDGDLAFELGPNLPEVLLTPEAATSIVSNLVENARKYAPVDPGAPGAEPILVRTRHEAGAVYLDVLDRGPGVPEGEEHKIFEAFYRVGSEATRRARGAGLGLHLVQLQANALGGDAGYRRRPGGGAWFWVRFRPAMGHAA